MIKNEIISGNSFKAIADDFLDEEKTYIDITKKPKTIFLKTDWIELFKSKVLPQIDYHFKLITHNADRPCPSGNLDLLEDARLIKWYGMNCQIQHPKLQPIPIGIANEKWPHGNKDTLLEIISTEIPKTNLCYSNFEVTTNFNKRTEVLNIVKTKSFIDIDIQKLSFKEYLSKLKSYKFVISPPGNSVDCHRIWEALYLDVIPIVEKNIAMNYFYDLPILFVDSFNELTYNMLEKEYTNSLKVKKDKIFLRYYQNLLHNI